MYDLTNAKEYAKQNIGRRPEREGRLRGKIAIITGSAQGFGSGIARQMYKEGASVAIADLNYDLALAVANELGGDAFAVKVDVGDEISVAKMMEDVVMKFGGIDIFVSNAGVLRAGAINEMDVSSFEFVTKINYIAPNSVSLEDFRNIISAVKRAGAY